MTSLAFLAGLAPAAAIIPQRFTAFCKWAGLDLTEGQGALARVAFDGEDPETPLERDLFGGVEKIPRTARRLMIFRLGRGSAKSTLCCAAYGVFRMVTGDVSLCGPGDEPGVGIVSPDVTQSELTLRKALAIVRGCPALQRMLVRTTTTSFTLRRPDGAKVAFVTKAKSIGGRAARGFSWLLFVVDEAEFMDPSQPDAGLKTEDVVNAAAPRVLPGGAIIMCSTPWPAETFPAKTFESNFGKPVHALAARGSTITMRGEVPELVAEREAAIARDPASALLEWDCVITDVSGTFFEWSAIDRAITPSPPRARRQKASSGVDLAFIRDSSGQVSVERQAIGSTVKVVVTRIDLMTPTPTQPLKPSETMEVFVENARADGCTALVGDGHYIQSLREHAAKADMQVVAAPTESKAKNAAAIYLRDLLREDLLVLPNDPRLVAQLKSALKLALPGGGMRMVLPRRSGTGHADLVAALVNAVWHDRRHGPMLRGEAGNVIDLPQTFAGGWST